MKLNDFDYKLPKELIAQKPLRPRDISKLMVLKNGKIKQDIFRNIINYLEKGDVLVLNETKVIRSKLVGKKETGSHAELIILNENQNKKGRIYACRIKASNPRIGTRFVFKNNLTGEIVKKENDLFYVKFNRKIKESELELPLPPYVKSKVEKEEYYQTAYAKKQGSVAAPTAGFHFTEELLDKIKNKGIKIAKVCLHIDFGTFLPVRDLDNHKMHKEFFSLDKKNAELINSRKGRLIAVGTTSVRTLESCSDENGKVHAKTGYTELFIYPGYKFKTKIDALITNFHLPKSTLLLLVCAYYRREKILDAYSEAVKKRYRFYSFGDGMIILK